MFLLFYGFGYVNSITVTACFPEHLPTQFFFPLSSQLTLQLHCRVRCVIVSFLSTAPACTPANSRVCTPNATNRLFLSLNLYQLGWALPLWTRVLHHSLWNLYRLPWTILAHWTRVRHHSLLTTYVLPSALLFVSSCLCALILSTLHYCSNCISVFFPLVYL